MKNQSSVLFLGLLLLQVGIIKAGSGFSQSHILSGRVRETMPENPNSNSLYFARPAAIGHDHDHIYGLDSIDSEIRVFSKSGAFLYAVGKKGQGPGEFDGPNDFWLDDGKIYVSDAGNGRVQILDRKGRYLGGFKLKCFPHKILVLDDKTVVVSHLPSATPGEFLRKEKLVQGYTSSGDLVWEAVDSLSDGDPVFETMQNRHVLKAFSGGFYFIRKCNDPLARLVDNQGKIVRTIAVDKKFEWKTIAVPARRGKKRRLSGLFWDCDTSGDFLYFLVPEFAPNGDIVAGRSLAVFKPDGGLAGRIDLPVQVNKISVDGPRIYVVDADYKMRIFLTEIK